MLRVTRSGGVVRVIDQEVIHQGSGPAGIQFTEMVVCALFRAGHLFEQESTGLTAHLARLLTQHGCRQVQTKTYPLEYRAGTPEGQMSYEDGVRAAQTLRPFIQKWGCISGDYEALCQQAFDDVRQPGYRATWNILSAWGTV
jgi:hypothetical protein